MLLSRVADALYWISRYLERAEHTARLIDVRLDLGLDRRAERRRLGLRPAVRGAAGWSRSPRRRRARPRSSTRSSSISTHPDSVLVVRDGGARERAPGARGDQLGHVGAAERAVPPPEAGARPKGRGRAGRTTSAAWSIEGVHLFAGVTDATMGHGEGWQYLQAGRYLERAGATAALVDLLLPRGRARWPPNHGEWVGLLRSCCGARGLLPLLHRRPPARARRRVPAAQSGVPAIGAVLRGARRVGAAGHRAAHRPQRPAAAPSGSPAACTRRSTTDRSTRSSTTIRTRISRHRPPLRADPRGRVPELHHVSDRVGAARLTRVSTRFARQRPCSTPSATSPASPTTRRSPRA